MVIYFNRIRRLVLYISFKFGEKGKGDYLLLHMVEGAIVFEVKSNEIIKTFHF